MTDTRTPLKPDIHASAGLIRICNCCQGAAEIVNVHFGWNEWPDEQARPHGGGTSVALCLPCRRLALRLLTSCTRTEP